MSVTSSSLIPFAVVSPELQPSFSFLDGVALMFISKAKKYTRRGAFSSRVCFITDDLLCVAHTDGKVTYCCKLEDIERIVTSSKEHIAGAQMRDRPFRYGKTTEKKEGMFFEVPVDVLLKFSDSSDYQNFVECIAQQAPVCTGEPLPVVSKEKKEKFQKLLVLMEDGLRTRPAQPAYHTKEEVRAQMSLQKIKPSKCLTGSGSGEPSVTLALALSASEGDRANSCDLSKKFLPAPEAASCSPTSSAAAAQPHHHPTAELPRSSTPEHPLPRESTGGGDQVPNPLSAPSESASMSVHRTSSEFFTVTSKKGELPQDDVNLGTNVNTNADANANANADVSAPSKKEKKGKPRKISGSNNYADSEKLTTGSPGPYTCLDGGNGSESNAAEVKRVTLNLQYMARITLDMLRRRAEHNEGCLSNLKEVALHQQDIEKIEVIGDCCRQLEILYLCNNYISKIEGLRHLKWLKYINLAVNNIKVIEGLEGCEALEKLDLTLNFIEDITCVRRLLANPFLETLHLTGNPCTKISGYRAYVVQTLPQLKDLDGSEVIKAERINARQVEENLQEEATAEAVKFAESERIKAEMVSQGIDPFPPKYNEQGERVYGHTAEERLQMLHEQQAQEEEKKKKEQEPAPGSISAIHKELNAKPAPLTPEEELAKYGRHLLRNEGKVAFSMDQDSADEFLLTVRPGKFIATSLLDVQVDVHCIRVYIKGKLLQVPVEEELAADSARVQRSQTTGELKISVPYSDEAKRQHKGLRAKQRLEGLQKKKESAAPVASTTKTETEDLRKALLFPEDDIPREKEALSRKTNSEKPNKVVEVLAEKEKKSVVEERETTSTILDLD